MTADRDEARSGAFAFPATRPSLIDALRDPDPDARRAAFGAIFEAYWSATYKYARLRHRLDAESAADRVQSFFEKAFEREFLADFDPRRARFRTFLRLAFDRSVWNAAAAARAEKRGGGRVVGSLDFTGAEREIAAREPVAEDVADAFFEQEWRRALLAGAVEDLRAECDRRGRATRFALFRALDLEPADPRPTYAELGREHGITTITVTNELAAARRDFRRALLDRLRAQTTSEEEFRDEMRLLLGEAP
jgi:RNA polymerase sigma factor (sigma-70 family)